MKRDMDLVRKILLAIEAHPPTLGPLKIQIDGYPKEIVDYHLTLMKDAGLIEGINPGSKSGLGDIYAMTIPMRMTWQGCEFLDASRDENRWNKAKEIVKEMGSSVSFDVLKSLLVQIMMAQIPRLVASGV